MDYRVISNSIEEFWNDKKTGSFGVGEKLVVKIVKNIISVKSNGVNVYLIRDGKRAKISTDNKTIKGQVVDGDKIYFDNEFVADFFVKKSKGINMPSINWNLWMGIVVLLLILVVIFLGWKKNGENNLEKKYNSSLMELNDKLAKSDEIKSIDPDTSLKLLNEAKGVLLLIKDNKKHESEVKDKEKLIDEKLAVGGSLEVTGFTDIYNTKSADIADRAYDKMTVVGNEAVIAESKTGKIILVNLDLGSVTKFDVGQQMVDIIFANKKVYFYDGISIFDSAKNKIVDTGSEVFVKIVSWNNSWYMLGQDGKISKVSDNKVGLWTGEKQRLIDKPVSMTIDGTVWVTDVNGNVINYEKGVEKKWSPSLKISGEKVLGITTTADSSKVAIITDKKVFVFDKISGELLATHNFEKIGIIEAKMGLNDQIYVLGQDQKIYKVK